MERQLVAHVAVLNQQCFPIFNGSHEQVKNWLGSHSGDEEATYVSATDNARILTVAEYISA